MGRVWCYCGGSRNFMSYSIRIVSVFLLTPSWLTKRASSSLVWRLIRSLKQQESATTLVSKKSCLLRCKRRWVASTAPKQLSHFLITSGSTNPALFWDHDRYMRWEEGRKASYRYLPPSNAFPEGSCLLATRSHHIVLFCPQGPVPKRILLKLFIANLKLHPRINLVRQFHELVRYDLCISFLF